MLRFFPFFTETCHATVNFNKCDQNIVRFHRSFRLLSPSYLKVHNQQDEAKTNSETLLQILLRFYFSLTLISIVTNDFTRLISIVTNDFRIILKILEILNSSYWTLIYMCVHFIKTFILCFPGQTAEISLIIPEGTKKFWVFLNLKNI